MLSRDEVNSLSLIIAMSNASNDARRHLYTYLPDKILGQLNQVDRQFRLFGNDVDMWKRRLRHLVPELNIPQFATAADYVNFYRFIIAAIELRAFSLQWLINAFFFDDINKQDNALNEILKELENKRWKPLNNCQLLQLATKLNADEKTYNLLLSTTKIELENVGELTVSMAMLDRLANDTPNENIDIESAEYLKLIASLISGGDKRVGYLRSTFNYEQISDSSIRDGLEKMIALGIALHNAMGFLLIRNHTSFLLTLLKIFYRKVPKLLNLEIQMDGQVKLGEQLFLMALGAQNLSCARQLFWLPGPVAPDIILWMISINADCIHASHKDLLHAVESEWDTDRLFYNPLYLTIESILDISNRSLEIETAKRYVINLQTIAIALIAHGEKFNAVAKITRNHEETPASLVNSSLARLESDNLSDVDIAIRDALQNLLDHLQQENLLINERQLYTTW